jgi:hypothetical protein
MDRLNILHKFLLLTVVALFVVNQTVLSRIQQDIHEALPELRIKNEVVRQGTGEHARVTVMLRDDRNIDGYISRITDDGFTLVDGVTGKDFELAYRIVKDIRETGGAREGVIASGLTSTARAIESLARTVQ